MSGLFIEKDQNGDILMNMNIGQPPNSDSSFNDWFLPAKDGLKAMYDQLFLFNVGNFNPLNFYWSSSELNATASYGLFFSNGIESGALKYGLAYVRACRAFAGAPGDYALRDVGPAGGLIFAYSGGLYYEAAPTDQSVNKAWSNVTNIAIGTTGTAIGTGQANTNLIIAQGGHTLSAAKLCDELSIDV